MALPLAALCPPLARNASFRPVRFIQQLLRWLMDTRSAGVVVLLLVCSLYAYYTAWLLITVGHTPDAESN